ncbi:unnamed protein product [Meloidogyne enterolobii]|uniref:Uncharacterized protein n=1 Tax=Meloidogyne enterolobii TaxID=390850 RepID=A0ACB0Z4N8_MELEN
MASVAFFVRFVAIVMLVVSIVYCDVVGHGRHELVNGKIVKLRGNTKMAEKPEDLELYKNMPGSCDVEMDKDGHITLWYLKHSNTTKEGCSIDLVVRDPNSEFPMRFGIQHNTELTDCLADMRFDRQRESADNMSAMTSNLLGFTFSLKNGEFDRVKGGFAERHKNFCGDVSKCKNRGGKCLEVGDHSVGWARTGDYVRVNIQHIGETRIWSCNSNIAHNKHEANALHYFDKESDFTNCIKTPRDYFCFKEESVRRPKKWRITDEDYTNKEYSSLFTFHILPITSMQTSMQNVWIKCDEDADKEDCNENAAFQQCDKMFVNFPHFVFKMLVPDNSVKQTTTGVSETTTMVTCPTVTCDPYVNCPAIDCPSVFGCPDVDCPPCIIDCPAKKDSKKTLQITLVIVGSIILLLMFTALLICLFVSKSK